MATDTLDLTDPATPAALIFTPEQRAIMRERGRRAAAEYAHRPGLEEVLGPERYAERLADTAPLTAAVAELVAARRAAGLSVAEVAERAGLPASVFERLEAHPYPEDTWAVFAGYARAVGRSLTLTVGPAAG